MSTPSGHPPPFNRNRPTHPAGKAYLLIIGVVIAIVLLAAISTFGAH
jgi:hypothetical protein